jgi:hypothetical protein
MIEPGSHLSLCLGKVQHSALHNLLQTALLLGRDVSIAHLRPSHGRNCQLFPVVEPVLDHPYTRVRTVQRDEVDQDVGIQVDQITCHTLLLPPVALGLPLFLDLLSEAGGLGRIEPDAALQLAQGFKGGWLGNLHVLVFFGGFNGSAHDLSLGDTPEASELPQGVQGTQVQGHAGSFVFEEVTHVVTCYSISLFQQADFRTFSPLQPSDFQQWLKFYNSLPLAKERVIHNYWNSCSNELF